MSHSAAEHAPSSRRAQAASARSWGNSDAENFNGTLRDEPSDRDVFDILPEAKVLIGRQRKAFSAVRPLGSPGRRLPSAIIRR